MKKCKIVGCDNPVKEDQDLIYNDGCKGYCKKHTEQRIEQNLRLRDLEEQAIKKAREEK